MIIILHVAVCEEDPLQLENIGKLLEKYQAERPGIEVALCSFDTGKGLLSKIDGGQAFDLFLLDILLPEMNGIELAGELRKRYPDAPIAFLTSTADFALDAFKVSAVQYILKPFKHEELFPVLDSVISMLSRKNERFFMLPTQKRIVKILYSSIVYVELAGRMLQFHLDSGDVVLGRTIRISFIEAISPLLEDNRFLCEHKSFALNMEHVEEIGNNFFKMKGGIEIPIPRYNFANAKSKYFSWVKQQEQISV